MSEPTKIETYREINPLVYSWSTPDVPKYAGWEKIGYTEQADSETRIKQQASQLSITQKKEWVRRALFMAESGGRFTDREFHAYLKQQGVERELKPKRTEWHKFEDEVKTSLDYFNAFAGQDYTDLQAGGTEFYELRPEQEAAVKQALAGFEAGHAEVLWNAKPRFGKTLTTYDLLRRLDVSKVLIVTNRPAIANSWYDDFVRFIGHQTTFQFVSESASLAEQNPMTRAQYRDVMKNDPSGDHRVIEFLSLQDLKGSRYFGGEFDKLRHIADLDWDVLVVDEAHEGVDTTKTDIAFEHIKRKYTLHLSGTPFKALAEGKFSPEQIYNWTYADEREALAQWEDTTQDNPYQSLPTLNMFTYQMSRMLSDQLELGMATEDDSANLDFAFDLSAFFATKPNGYFEHEADVIKFLKTLTTNEKYPFSTPALRDEIRHSFWLLDRVASARALERLLKQHEVFKDYTIILAAGDGRSDDGDLNIVGKSLDRVRSAIKEAEATGGRTITLSVGQLTTGVTIPEWTAVLMLSNLTSPALYMQAAFRAQNPCTFERGGKVLQKKNAYIFDFAPERTLTIYDQFANNLRPNPSGDPAVRQDNIRTLLNFFPVIGEDSEGRMEELDASQVLTYPQVFKAREVVRRGFLSNLLFANVAGIFRYPGHYIEVLEKLPKAKADKVNINEKINMPEPPPTLDADGNASVDFETVINPKVAALGKPIWKFEDVRHVEGDSAPRQVAQALNKLVEEKLHDTRLRTQEEYALTKQQVERDKKATKAKVDALVEQTFAKHKIAQSHIEAELEEAPTEAEAQALREKQRENDAVFKQRLLEAVEEVTSSVPEEIVQREETRKEQRRVDDAVDAARDHLRGFARTIPMFLMAYGDRDLRLANFDDYTPDDVFEEITGITEAEFRMLRDGQTITNDDGTTERIPGLFDEAVFNQSVQEFLDKKEALADYFDDSLTENIFAYIPRQKTSLVFPPQGVVTMMVDELERCNPGIFSDPDRSFADLFSTAGLFLMEIVRRLDSGLAHVLPDQNDRLRHILSHQLFEMSHNEILHRITLEAVSGGIDERKRWMEDSGHYRVGNLAKMGPDQRHAIVNDMLDGRTGMTDKKFDVVIGNPPYQDDRIGDNETKSPPIYDKFMDAAFSMGTQAVLVTPGRFLSNAGQTSKKWNERMLTDKHLRVAFFEPKSGDIFPGTDIRGGIVVTHRDVRRTLGPIGTMSHVPKMASIAASVAAMEEPPISSIITEHPCKWTPTVLADHPELKSRIPTKSGTRLKTNTFSRMQEVCWPDRPDDGHEYIQVFGLEGKERVLRWIRRDYLITPPIVDQFKVVLAAANGSGDFGETLTSPEVMSPGIGLTQTFMAFGGFESQLHADACRAYIKSKFARSLLGIRKTTQHNPAIKWEHVPLQDFSASSGIDWSKSIPEIDQQLYAKYGLSTEEIDFIEENVQSME